MLDSILRALRVPFFDIRDREVDVDLYLRRFYIYRGKHRPHIYLHHIMRSDNDIGLHNHPWDFTSVMLWGSYEEVVPWDQWKRDGRYVNTIDDPYFKHAIQQLFQAPRIIRRDASCSHRLILKQPVWTLVFTGERRQDWGFWTKEGWVKWDKLKQHIKDLMP